MKKLQPLHFFQKLLLLLAFAVPGWVMAQADSLAEAEKNLHAFHRKEADIVNYLMAGNFHNPALAGALKSYHAEIMYGHSRPGSYLNDHYGQIWLDLFFGKKQGRHGLSHRGAVKHIGFNTHIRHRLDYSFQVLNKKNISIRLGAGIGFRLTDYTTTRLTFSDQIDDRYGFVYTSQENDSIHSVGLVVDRLQWNVGLHARIFNGYLNIYNTQDIMSNIMAPGNGRQSSWGWGMNAFYHIHTSSVQIFPSIDLLYWNPQLYTLQGGVMLGNSTTKGGSGGVYYNSNNIFTLMGLFAWNDYLRISAQVQFPFSDIRKTNPVNNFQVTLSYKINHLNEYE